MVGFVLLHDLAGLSRGSQSVMLEVHGMVRSLAVRPLPEAVEAGKCPLATSLHSYVYYNTR